MMSLMSLQLHKSILSIREYDVEENKRKIKGEKKKSID